jgi:hypothetical protein
VRLLRVMGSSVGFLRVVGSSVGLLRVVRRGLRDGNLRHVGRLRLVDGLRSVIRRVVINISSNSSDEHNSDEKSKE